ncbi:MAG: HAD-IIIC family phosphatase [Lachnospiraceae bacterium]|nr:HAD-IIIC family phosphatase [Lachnospiraceae bacterium]
MKELEWPFDGEWILSKKKSIKRQLLQEGGPFLQKKIAVLGGSTTSNLCILLDLFLLNQGIQATFYESEYNQYYEDAMFDKPELVEFGPDVIFIHTTNVNIKHYPEIRDSEEVVSGKLDLTFQEFEGMWEHLYEKYHCPIIQNNFELPSYRLLGNHDAVDMRGRVSFINSLNEKFAEYGRTHDFFHLHDIAYLSATVGLDRFSDPFYWHMYKYAVGVPVMADFCYNLSHIIKAIYGKNKKAFVLDLDNTLWGGIVGDDGPENLQVGQETSMGQAYDAFQRYLKAHKDIGILLNVNSKNEAENALAGLNHQDCILKPEDFVVIKANWEPKNLNTAAIAQELNLGIDSLVFVDDNPAEREIINSTLPAVSVPEVSTVDKYIREIDRHGYFEVLKLSGDDLSRNEMYKANAMRAQTLKSFADYGEYLKSLEMKAVIKPFEPLYMARIAQLTNKSNQFNLTTKRYSQSEIEEAGMSRLTFYGKLEDKFGDNGVVTVAIGRPEENTLHMELWLMSCRVLKRDMELALLDAIVHRCKANGIDRIMGYYDPTAKNAMVKNFYGDLGFTKLSEDEEGNTTWEFKIPEEYQDKNKYIAVSEN